MNRVSADQISKAPLLFNSVSLRVENDCSLLVADLEVNWMECDFGDTFTSYEAVSAAIGMNTVHCRA